MTDREPELALRTVSFKLSQADIDRLRTIVKWRYPEDTHMMAKTLRELIREEYEREQAKRERSGK